ncbi:MAG: glycosyltransferase [Ramlibacter sp.]|nr:glycosyltransferase [Ramlibacter sp.]
MGVTTFRDERWRPVRGVQEMAAEGRRVLVLSHMFPHPEQPGSGPFVLEQVQALRASGVDARVICGRPYWMSRSPLRLPRSLWAFVRSIGESRRQWWMLDGVPVRYVPYPILAPFWSHGWSYRMAVRASLRNLRREFAPALIHAHTGYLDGSAARMLAHAWEVPYVVTEHTGPFSILMNRSIIRRTTLGAIAGAARVVGVSRALLREVLDYLPGVQSTATVIPNVVDVDRFAVTPLADAKPEAPRLLFVGYFVEVKNIPLLLDAFAQVLAAKPLATLTLAGGGTTVAQTESVREDIARRGLQQAVCVRGWVPREEVAGLMRQSDMLVLQSRSETFGCVVTEALATGRPVVATRCGGPEDIVTESWLGALCDNNDPQALAQAILDVADRLGTFDPQRMGAFTRDRFGAVSVARRLIQLYEEVLLARQAPASQQAASNP